MRRWLLASSVLCLIAAYSTPAHGQFRGGLTSRPSAPIAVPHSPAAPPPTLLPLWWHWGVVMRPDITLTPPRVIDGGPTGGVQLDVLPWSAQVYVDGALAGRVEDFRGYYHHLELTAGPHILTIVHAGSAPLVLDLVVVPGRTITYRGNLR